MLHSLDRQKIILDNLKNGSVTSINHLIKSTKFNQSTIINFEHGKLIIKDSWKPKQNMMLELINRTNKSNINFKIQDNIYSHQIKNISNHLLQKKTKPIFPSIAIDEIEINTKLLSEWINLK